MKDTKVSLMIHSEVKKWKRNETMLPAASAQEIRT